MSRCRTVATLARSVFAIFRINPPQVRKRLIELWEAILVAAPIWRS